nr:unnamed protein product [Spirometra erinaceieuropaei]
MTAKSARDDWKQYWAEIATFMERASNVGDTRRLYRLIRQVNGKPSTLSDSVRDVNGGFFADNSPKSNDGVSTLSTISTSIPNSPRPCSPLQPSSFPLQPMQCHATPLLKEWSSMPYESCAPKAPKEDGLPAGIFKSCVDTLAPWLHEKHRVDVCQALSKNRWVFRVDVCEEAVADENVDPGVVTSFPTDVVVSKVRRPLIEADKYNVAMNHVQPIVEKLKSFGGQRFELLREADAFADRIMNAPSGCLQESLVDSPSQPNGDEMEVDTSDKVVRCQIREEGDVFVA